MATFAKPPLPTRRIINRNLKLKQNENDFHLDVKKIRKDRKR
jgi:hypothetical protein